MKTVKTVKAAWQPHAWQTQSLLLAYPDVGLTGRTALARRVLPALPPPVAEPLRGFLEQVEDTPPLDLAAHYVATFDHRKRCSLHLTYYAHGDTRKRGAALLRLKQAYARTGLRLTDEELPDHLAVVLEFAAASASSGESPGGTAGLKLLTGHRAGLELLRLALRDLRSPWAGVLDSVSATLPALSGDEHTAVARLAAQGPPEEQVGLAPFTPPEVMPTAPAQTGGPR